MPFNNTSSQGTVPYYGGKQVSNAVDAIFVSGAPSTNATGISFPTIAIDPTAGNAYISVKNTGINGSVTWDQLGLSTGTVGSLTGDSGGPETPLAGNINLLGTANQITTTGTANTITWTLPAAITAPGSLITTTTNNATTTMTAGTGITSTTGNIVATAGAVNAGTTMTAGTGITATTGNISATAGAVNAGTSMTATLGDITATNGDFVASTAAKGPKVVGTTVTGATPVVNSVRAGQVGFSDVINAAAVGALVMTNTLVTAASVIIAISTCATVGSACAIRDIVPGSGTVTFNVTNLGGTNTGTTIFINFWILN